MRGGEHISKQTNDRDFYTCVGEVNFSAAYLKKHSTAGKKKDDTDHFHYSRDQVISYVEGKVKERIMNGGGHSINDLKIDCAVVSYGQGVMNITKTDKIEE